MCKSDQYTLVKADSLGRVLATPFRIEDTYTLGLLVVELRVISRVLLSIHLTYIPYTLPSVRSTVLNILNFPTPVSSHASPAPRISGDLVSKEVFGNSSQDAGI